MSDDLLGQVLSAQSVRFLRALCEDEPRDADPILAVDEHLDSEAYEELCYELHHMILPELAAEGLVEFAREETEVWRGPAFDSARPFSDRAPNGHETRPWTD